MSKMEKNREFFEKNLHYTAHYLINKIIFSVGSFCFVE